MRSASSAFTWRPVIISSLARTAPTAAASRCVPPPPGMMPSRISGWPNTARSTGDAVVAGQRQLAAAAERVARDRGDDEPRDGRHGVERAVEALGDGPRLGRAAELADVGAGGEDALAAGDHDRAGRVGGQRPSDLVELGEQRLRQRVHLRVVQGDDGHAVVTSFEQHEFAHGADPTRQRRSVRRRRTRSISSAAAHGSMRALEHVLLQLVPPLAGDDLAGPLLEPAGDDLAQLLAQAELAPAVRARRCVSMCVAVREHRGPQLVDALRPSVAIDRHDRRAPGVVRPGR